MKPIFWPTTALFFLIFITGCPDYSALREAPDYTKMTDSGDEIDAPSQTVADAGSKVDAHAEPVAKTPTTSPVGSRRSRRASTDWTTWMMYVGGLAAVPVLVFVLLKWTPIFRKEKSTDGATPQTPTVPLAPINSTSTQVVPGSVPRQRAAHATNGAASPKAENVRVGNPASSRPIVDDDGEVQLDDEDDFDLSVEDDFELNVEDDFELSLDTHEIASNADDNFENAVDADDGANADDADDDFEIGADADDDELDLDDELELAVPTENTMNVSSYVTESNASAKRPVGTHRGASKDTSGAMSDQFAKLEKRVAELTVANQSLTEKVEQLREQRNVATKKLGEKIAQLDQIEQSKARVATDHQLSEMSHDELVEALRSARENEAAFAKRLEQTSTLNQRLRKKLRQKMDVIRKVANVRT